MQGYYSVLVKVHGPGLRHPGLFCRKDRCCHNGQSFGISMKPLIGALACLVLSAPVFAEVDPKIAEMCLKAQDFSGCVQTMTGGSAATTDEVQKLRSVMKKVAARLENGVSYRDSTDTFRPLVDQLAVTKESNENELAVKVAERAEILFNIMQASWYGSIRYDGIAIAANEPIRKWNLVIGMEHITPLKEGCAFGICSIKTSEHDASVRLMNRFVIGILKEGTVKQSTIDGFNSKRDEAIKLSKMDAWNKYLATNPGLAAWAKANPSIAEEKRKEYNSENPVTEIDLPTYAETLDYLRFFKPSLF